MNALRAPERRPNGGFTLVELMVAMAIGLFLIAGASTVYLSSRSANIDINDLSRMQEGVRFAGDFLVRDIRNAGFRDEGRLVLAEWQSIGAEPVQLDVTVDGVDYPLVVRYSGLGSCVEEFDQPQLVENHYRIAQAADGQPALACWGGPGGPDEQILVSGVSRFDAVPLCAPGNPGCACPADCVGLRIGLEFQSRNLAVGIGRRSIELRAVFRNRVYEGL